MTLHDAHEVEGYIPTLAHSLSDEAYKRPEPDPYVFHVSHVIRFVVGVVLLYGSIFAFLIFGTAAS